MIRIHPRNIKITILALERCVLHYFSVKCRCVYCEERLVFLSTGLTCILCHIYMIK